MTEATLQYELHRALILTNPDRLAPFLSDDMEIIGAQPLIVIGSCPKEKILNLIEVTSPGTLYKFQSSFRNYPFEGKIKRGLYVEYISWEECIGKLDVFFDHADDKITTLYLLIKECEDHFWGVDRLDSPAKDIWMENNGSVSLNS